MDDPGPAARCGFTISSSDLNFEENIDEEKLWTKIRGTTCCRTPIIDGGKCIFHSENEQKDTGKLATYLDGSSRKVVSANLRGLDFFGYIDLSDSVLPGSNLEDSRLFFGNLIGVNLNYSNLSNSDFTLSQFQSANLVNVNADDSQFGYANISAVNLEESSLKRTDLREARAQHCLLNSATLTKSDARGADFRYSFARMANFREVNLSNANLKRSNIWKANFTDANCSDANLRECKASYAEFNGANLERAYLWGADLSGTDFRDANLRNANLTGADLRGCNLQNADLGGATLSESDLRYADLSGANLQGCEVIGADLRNADFRDTNLQESTLSKSLCEDTLFIRTDLRGADFSNARLYQAQFSDLQVNSHTSWGEESVYEKDDVSVKGKWNKDRLEAAAWTYRRLEKLLDENALAARSREMHIRKEEAQREFQKQKAIQQDGPEQSLSSGVQYVVSSVNWHLTRHGESLQQIVKISSLVILVSGLLYPAIGGIASSSANKEYHFSATPGLLSGQNIEALVQSLYFSTITFSTIGYGDFYPAGPGSKALVSTESLIGAILMALFIFVLGRRVAR